MGLGGLLSLPGRLVGGGGDDGLTWARTEVQGRPATYCVGGEGPPVVFVHGWALGTRTYRGAVRQLTSRSCRVLAPDLPGSGGTASLPTMTIEAYAEWVDDFLTAAGIDEPALVIGHSFGGGVAIKLAHARPERVRYLVLLNSVGGSPGMGDRPLWDWALHFTRELLPRPQNVDVLQAVWRDAVRNALRNPLGVWRAGELARAADLTVELAELQASALPMLAVTTDGDGVIPQDAFEALCRTVGTEGHVLAGRHSWLLADPDTFGEVLANVVEVQVAEHRSSRTAELLAATRVPAKVAAQLLDQAAPLWLMSESPAVLAGDLALCHPPLAPGEVRAVARAVEGSNAVRLTVVAEDRAGLLADSASVLTGQGVAIGHASAVTWPSLGLAMHSFTLDAGTPLDDANWELIGTDLRAVATGRPVPPPVFVPIGDADVTVHGEGERCLVRITAPDQLGLLWAICRWFADHDVTIETVDATTSGLGEAVDSFVVAGRVDADDLAEFLSRPPRRWLARRLTLVG